MLGGVFMLISDNDGGVYNHHSRVKSRYFKLVNRELNMYLNNPLISEKKLIFKIKDGVRVSINSRMKFLE